VLVVWERSSDLRFKCDDDVLLALEVSLLPIEPVLPWVSDYKQRDSYIVTA